MRWPSSIPRPRPETWFYLVAALVASAPAWIVRHPPLQDMPFHLSTLRVVHDYGNPKFGFQGDFELNLGHTSYLLYYVAGSLLAYVVGVYNANVALMAFCLGGLPLGMRSFLKAVGKDERLCLFAVPLGVNVMFVYGLLPYVFGLPIMFFAMAAMVRHFQNPTRKSGVILAVLSAALFFAHIFPFGLFAIAAVAYFPFTKPAKWKGSIAAMVPSVLLLVWWLRGSAAGKQAGGSLKDALQPIPLSESFRSFFSWSTDVFRDETDEKWFLGLAFVALAGVVLSAGDRSPERPNVKPFGVVLAISVVSFFALGDHLGEVWLFAQRFPVPALLCVVPFLSIPRGVAGTAVTAALCAVGLGSTLNVCTHFIDFERKEVGQLDEAIENIDYGKKVCGLIYDKGTMMMHHAPFLHYVSYYQAERGGVTMFSYAHFLHWPFRFKEGKLPPPGTPARPRWEWTPEQVPISEIYPYYDYVLVRGSGFSPPAGTYHVKWRGERWTVYAKDAP